MNEWKEVKIGDVCSVKRGASPRPIQNFMCKNGMPWVKIADATRSNSRYIYSTEEYIIEAGVPKSRTVTPGTLIVSNSATPGLPKIMGITGCVHDGWLIIDDFKGVLKEYMYYKFIDIRRVLSNQANGSVFLNLKTDIVKDFPIKMPSIQEQEIIVAFLENIDAKIECNQKICENLEAQAQALFKHWFIDFAPFKDGKFVESDLGMVPEGWRIGKLEELGDVVGGATPSKSEESYYTSKGIAWLTPKDLSNKRLKFTSRGEIDLTQEGYNSCSAKLMPKGSVLFSSRAPIGYLTIAKNDICTNQGFKSVVPKYAGTAYIYYLLKVNTKRIERMSSGTTFKEASGSLMKSLAVLIPPKNIIDNYESSVADIFNEQELKEQENLCLSALRDALLPKLMSGQIKL